MEIPCLQGATHGDILKPSSEAQTVSKLKVAQDNFPQVKLTKLFRVLKIVWQEYDKGYGRDYELLLYSKSVHTYRVCAVL